MNQMPSVQRPVQTMAPQPMGGVSPRQPPIEEKKKSNWLFWVIIILAVLIIGVFALWLFTP